MLPEGSRWRVRVYLWFDSWFQRWLRLLGILHEAFWVACVDSRDVTALGIRSCQRSRMYQSLEHNQSGLFPWERDAVLRFLRAGSRILVAAAGGGRELVALHHLGFKADGFDCTPSLFESSRRLLQELGVPSKVTLCPPNEVPPELALYDGLIVGWGGYTQIPGSGRRIAFLRKLRALVPPDPRSSSRFGSEILRPLMRPESFG